MLFDTGIPKDGASSPLAAFLLFAAFHAISGEVPHADRSEVVFSVAAMTV